MAHLVLTLGEWFHIGSMFGTFPWRFVLFGEDLCFFYAFLGGQWGNVYILSNYSDLSTHVSDPIGAMRSVVECYVLNWPRHTRDEGHLWSKLRPLWARKSRNRFFTTHASQPGSTGKTP